MHSYLIYQRPLDEDFQDELNGTTLTTKKKAYFDLLTMPDGSSFNARSLAAKTRFKTGTCD